MNNTELWLSTERKNAIDIWQGWGKIYCQYIVKLFAIINIQYNILLYNK